MDKSCWWNIKVIQLRNQIHIQQRLWKRIIVWKRKPSPTVHERVWAHPLGKVKYGTFPVGSGFESGFIYYFLSFLSQDFLYITVPTRLPLIVLANQWLRDRIWKEKVWALDCKPQNMNQKVSWNWTQLEKKRNNKKKPAYKTWCLCPKTYCSVTGCRCAVSPRSILGMGPSQWFVLPASVTSAVRNFFYVYVLLAHMYYYIMCVPGAHGDQKRSSDPLDSTDNYELLCR